MKLDVMRPERVGRHQRPRAGCGRASSVAPTALHLGAFVTMADAAEHPEIRRDYPVIAQALDLAASPQIRNMATLGGNVLQRTRCNYFRDPSWGACNKREPGTGCAALDGVNRKHAVLGRQRPLHRRLSRRLRAGAGRARRRGRDRRARRRAGHAVRGAAPCCRATRRISRPMLAPGELITGFRLPVGAVDAALALPEDPRPAILRIRAWLRAAVALDLDDGIVNEARIALGGVATKPWRAREAEAALNGKRSTKRRAAARRRGRFRRRANPRRQRLQARTRPAGRWCARCCKPPRLSM